MPRSNEINGGRMGMGGKFTRPGRDRVEGCRDRFGNCMGSGALFDPEAEQSSSDPYRPDHPYNLQGYLRSGYDTGRGG